MMNTALYEHDLNNIPVGVRAMMEPFKMFLHAGESGSSLHVYNSTVNTHDGICPIATFTQTMLVKRASPLASVQAGYHASLSLLLLCSG